MDEKIFMAELGDRMIALRESRGWSQDELAEKLNVSRQTVSNWENGKVRIDIVKASEVADVFGITLDELCGKCIAPDDQNAAREVAAETPDGKAKEKRHRKSIIALLAAVMAVFSVLGVYGIIQAATGSDERPVSSVISLSPYAAGVLIFVVAVVAVVVCAILLARYIDKTR